MLKATGAILGIAALCTVMGLVVTAGCVFSARLGEALCEAYDGSEEAGAN